MEVSFCSWLKDVHIKMSRRSLSITQILLRVIRRRRLRSGSGCGRIGGGGRGRRGCGKTWLGRLAWPMPEYLVFTAMGYPRDSGVEWWQDEMLALFNAPLACYLLSGFGCFSDQGCLQNKKTVMSAKALCRACAGHVCSAHLASIQGT